MKKSAVTILLILTFICSFSCNVKKDEIIVFDNSEPLALAPDISWAVVSDPYAAYRDDIGWNVKGNGHCRRGEILQIKGKSIDKNKEVWYSFENGWLPASCVNVFDNRLKAENFSKKLDK